MKLLRKYAAVAAVLAAFTLATPAPAPAQTLQQVQSVTQWSNQFQRIVANFVATLQTLPNPPQAGMNRNERQAWATATREWAASTQQTLAAARVDLANMPPTPPAVDALSTRMRTAMEGALPRLREALDAGDQIAIAYLSLADAVERNQMDRVDAIRVAAIDAALISSRLFEDTNAAQAAAATEGNPQGPLAQSYAYSYAGLHIVLSYRRALLAGDPVDRSALANALAQTAQGIRAASLRGRSDLSTIETQINSPALYGIDPALVPRLRALAASYPASFSREEDIAGDFEAMAEALRTSDGGQADEAEIDRRLEAFSARDAQRGGDLARRSAIMTAP